MEKGTWRFARLAFVATKVGWCAANVLLLAWWLRLDAQRLDAQVLILVALNVLSFPLGFCFYVLIGLLDVLLNGQISGGMPGGNWDVVLGWSLFFLTGYLQWFKVVPFLVRKLRANRRSGGQLSLIMLNKSDSISAGKEHSPNDESAGDGRTGGYYGPSK